MCKYTVENADYFLLYCKVLTQIVWNTMYDARLNEESYTAKPTEKEEEM